MNFDTLHIILIGFSFGLILFIIILFIRLKGRNSIANKKIKVIAEKFDKEKLYLEKEIKRQLYIIEDYKQKNGFKRASIDSTSENVLIEKSLIAQNTSNENSLSSIVAVTDDSDFKEKNRKLWELSIAVHKEKERIDKLKTEIERRHDEVTKSITYAQRIQKALLPSSKILGVRFTDYFILWRPRDIVSGDFYWFKRLEDSMIIAVADCTGHGVPGAFMSLLGISFLNDILTKDKTLKSFQILDKLREMIKLALQQKLRVKSKATDGIDMTLCIINNKSLEMDFTGANNPLYLIRDNEIRVFKENRNPVGIHPTEEPFKNHIFQLKKDDKIYMFSDGFIDQFGGKHGRKFLKNNFQRLLVYISQQNLSMEEEKEVLEETFLHWKGESQPQIDDILVVGIKI